MIANLRLEMVVVPQLRYILFSLQNEDRVSKSAMIRARVDPKLKIRAEALLAHLGLSATTAITLFYRQVVLRRGLPFELHVPNAVTQRAIQSARAGRGVIRADAIDELLVQLDDGASTQPVRTAKRRTRG